MRIHIHKKNKQIVIEQIPDSVNCRGLYWENGVAYPCLGMFETRQEVENFLNRYYEEKEKKNHEYQLIKEALGNIEGFTFEELDRKIKEVFNPTEMIEVEYNLSRKEIEYVIIDIGDDVIIQVESKRGEAKPPYRPEFNIDFYDLKEEWCNGRIPLALVNFYKAREEVNNSYILENQKYEDEYRVVKFKRYLRKEEKENE